MTIIAPKHWKEIVKYSVYKDGFRVGVRDDAPQEVKDAYKKLKDEYDDATKKGTSL